MENLKTTEKVNKITKLISQASFIRKQMNYGMENFHIINDMLFDKISEKGVIADWREPDVIRIAPVALYNSYMDVFRFAKILKDELI